MRTRNTDKEGLVKEKAIELLVKEGFQGFSMAKLAKASKISVATLYIYYHDKDDLLKQIGVEIGKLFFETVLSDFDPMMPFANGLRKQWDNRIAFSFDNPLRTKCYDIIRHSPHGEYVMEEAKKGFEDVMRNFTQNAIKNKELTPISLEVYWSLAYGPLYNMLQFHAEGKSLGNKPFAFNQAIKEEALKLVIKALTP